MMISAEFHLTHRKLNPGDTIQPGNWGAGVIAAGPSHEWYEREQVMEAVRGEHYSSQPSRLDAGYFFPHLEHALHYWASFAQGDRIYSIQVVNLSAPNHHTFMTCLPPLTNLTDEQVAHQYWRADLRVGRGKYGMETEEILTTSELIVTQEFLLTADMFEDPDLINVDLASR